MKYFFTLVIICFIASPNSHAQKQKPCSSPEGSQFDFWIGNWELTWNDTSKGTNRITKIMDGCTIEENFNDPALKYSGRSWSVYNPKTQLWQQTWVDNQGGYIVLTGGKGGDSMILKTAERMVPVTGGPRTKMTNRMVFYNITPRSFNWRWEASTDGGVTWKTNWLIHYKRKA